MHITMLMHMSKWIEQMRDLNFVFQIKITFYKEKYYVDAWICNSNLIHVLSIWKTEMSRHPKHLSAQKMTHNSAYSCKYLSEDEYSGVHVYTLVRFIYILNGKWIWAMIVYELLGLLTDLSLTLYDPYFLTYI